MAVRNRLSNDVQKRVIKCAGVPRAPLPRRRHGAGGGVTRRYLTDDGEKAADQIPQQVNIDELPMELQREIKGLTDMLAQEIRPMLLEQTMSVQRMLQVRPAAREHGYPLFPRSP